MSDMSSVTTQICHIIDPEMTGMQPTGVNGERIRELRERRGWSRFDLCAATADPERPRSHVSESTIVRAERGERVTIERLMRIASALGVDLSEIYAGSADLSVSAIGGATPPEWFTSEIAAIHAKLDTIIRNQEALGARH